MVGGIQLYVLPSPFGCILGDPCVKSSLVRTVLSNAGFRIADPWSFSHSFYIC